MDGCQLGLNGDGSFGLTEVSDFENLFFLWFRLGHLLEEHANSANKSLSQNQTQKINEEETFVIKSFEVTDIRLHHLKTQTGRHPEMIVI